jgi:acetate---CoA ligase (ADP-forming) subunit beta
MLQIPFEQAEKLLREYKIPLIPSKIFSEEEEAWDFVVKNAPVAMKIDSSEAWHRTETGGIFLNVKDEKEFHRAWKKIMIELSGRGVIIQKMFSGMELSLGAKRDQQFGPVVMFGLGGIWIEILKDVSLRVAPIDQKEAQKMLEEIRGYELINGFRGLAPINQKKLTEMIVHLGDLMIDHSEIEEIDLNPVMAERDLVEAVDLKIWINNE